MSSHNTNIEFKSILHQVLKMTPFCSYTSGESRTPLIYRFVYDVLSNAMPYTLQALTQLVDVIYAFLVDPLLHYSPDMNPVDYKIWAVMQQQVYEKRVNDVDELCQRLLSVWHSIGQNVIDKAIDQWHARLTTCAKGVILSTWCKIDLN